MSDSLFKFGRYEGRPHSEVAIEDPAYFVWAHEEGLINAELELYQIALDIMPTDSSEFDEEYEYDNPPIESYSLDEDNEDGC